MIYLIYGNDGAMVRKKLHDLLEALSIKKPNAEVFRITSESWVTEGWNVEGIDELTSAQGLFEHKYIVVLDTLLANKPNKENNTAADILIEKINELADSKNVFIFVEGSLQAGLLEKITKKAVKVWKCDEKPEKSTSSKASFNVFAITDAFGRRDKKSLWTMYHRAILSGSEPEELHGLLFWQVKSMIIAANSKNSKDAGQKPFVWSKAQGFLKNYSGDELAKISSSLVNIYHNARRGILDFDIALEKFILNI